MRRHRVWSILILIFLVIVAQLLIKVSILPSIRNPLYYLFIRHVPVWQKIAWRVIDDFWVGSRALRREERVVCVSVRAGTHLSNPLVKQNPWNAEECIFWTWSSVLLQTGEFCTLHSRHNTWFTLSHQRKRWRMHTVTQAHTTHTHTCSHFPSSTQQHAAHRLTHVTHPLAIGIFVCKSSVEQTGALVDTSQPEHL